MALIEKSYEGKTVHVCAGLAAILLGMVLVGFGYRFCEGRWAAGAGYAALVALFAAMAWWRWQRVVDLAILNLPLWLILPMRLGLPNFSIVEVALLAAGFGGGIRIAREGRFRWYSTPIAPYMALFAALAVLSCVLYFVKWFIVLDPVFMRVLFHSLMSLVQIDQASPFHPLRGALTVIEGIVFFHVIVARVRDGGDVRRMIRLSIWPAVLVSLFGVFQYFTDWNKVDFEPWGHRVNSTFPDVNSLASFLVANLFLLMGLLSHGTSRKPRPMLWFALLSLTACFYLAHSRIAYGAAIVVLPLFFLLRGKTIAVEKPIVWLHKKRRFLAAVLVLSMITLGFVFLGMDWVHHNDLAWTRGSGMIPRALKGRLNIWRAAFYNTARSPWLGQGVGTFYNFLPWGWERDVAPGEWNWNPFMENAHNHFVQTTTEMGVIGLGFLLLILGLSLYQGLRALLIHGEDQRAMFAGLTCAVTAFLLTCLTGHPLLIPDINLWFWFAVALLFAPSATESAEFAIEQSRRKGLRRILLVALLAGVLLKSVDALERRVPVSIGYGFHDLENIAPYGYRYSFMWLKRHAVFRLYQQRPDVMFSLRNPRGQAFPITVFIRVNGEEIDRIELADAKWHACNYRLPDTIGTAIKVEIISDRDWSPPGDNRRLTVMLQSLVENSWW